MSNGVFVGGGEILRGGMGAKMEGGGGCMRGAEVAFDARLAGSGGLGWCRV